ncbi:MAG: AAA family ATPase [Deltaproteobacteria bacterium]|jgi:DNA helicase II / ATP-dependent DNA helicase PcrA|nr:AAA family ATPase [Deltaproteobacteria bacterium]
MSEEQINITKEQIETIVIDEESRWCRVHAAVVDEMNRANGDMKNDRKLARQLTAELVGSRSVEDKVQLASDEAVAHGLSKLRREMKDDYDTIAKQLYFARVVTDEEGKEVEFCLGTSSFPKHRIVDWRKAPISQLYYNYKQGEEFDEVIQDRERSGVIKLRRGYKGKEDDLHVVEMPEGIARKAAGKWEFEATDELLSRSAGHDGHLPPILSLITSEQFDLISHSPDKPVIIQGIAGSGKTTVALHRLAWLLHEDNSDAAASRCMVVVFNRSLKSYIENTLPELEVGGVAIKTYDQWLGSLAREYGGGWPYDDIKKSRESEQFKSSPICLNEINHYVSEYPDPVKGAYLKDLYRFYEYLSAKEIFWPRWKEVSELLLTQAKTRRRDRQDDSVMLNMVYAREGYYPCKVPGKHNRCDHIVIDEAQDFGVVEIRALLGALDVDKTVTIVGDLAQKIVMNRHFGSWQELLGEAGFSDTTPIELNVSHRTTTEIMNVAAHLRNDLELKESASQTVRHGPEPSIIQVDTYEAQPEVIGKWITERVARNRDSLSAVICRWPKQAEHLTAVLKKIGYPFVRWGHRDSFDFSPGVTITNVNQVKGLEFRNVLIVNPTEAQFNSRSEEERNLLYVAVTRAEVHLDFITRDRPTAMLPDLLKHHVGIAEE